MKKWFNIYNQTEGRKMKSINVGFYDSYHKIGYNMDLINYKEFLKEICNIYIDMSCRKNPPIPTINDLSERQRRKLVSLLIKADPDHLDAISETKNKLGLSLLHAITGEISGEEFTYYTFTVFCEYYTDEINKAFIYAHDVESKKEYWRRKAA